MIVVVSDRFTTKQHAACLEVERYPALELDSTDKKFAWRRVDQPSARLENVVNSALMAVVFMVTPSGFAP